jgi:BlaI family transcriptional regulator, penicillinase repressor
MKEITQAQEEILMALWQINDGAVSDVLNQLPDPKPAYNTVATVIKVLEKKGYLSHRAYGKTNVYYPLVSKNEYLQQNVTEGWNNFFNNSLSQMVSFFVKQKKVNLRELEELRKLVESEIAKQK